MKNKDDAVTLVLKLNVVIHYHQKERTESQQQYSSEDDRDIDDFVDLSSIKNSQENSQ